MQYSDIDSTYRLTLGEENDDAIIGNEIQKNVFEADLKVTCWTKENFLSLAYENFEGAPIERNGDIVISKQDTEFYFRKHDSERIKFGLIFKKKPSTNIIRFKLTGWQEFNFWYQRPLTQADKDSGLSCLPEVEGSYAVYHKTKKNHIVGRTNYKTGKAFHIYRPKFIDANGQSVWGDMNIDKDAYTITIPQKFIDTAKYPIRENTDLGKTSIGAVSDSSQGNVKNCAMCKVTATEDGEVSTVSIYFYGGRGGFFMTTGFWNDNGNYPGTKVADTASWSMSAGNWRTNSLDALTEITNGNSYWIGFNSNVTALLKLDWFGGSSWWTWAGYVPGTLSNFAGGGTELAFKLYSIYMTYEATPPPSPGWPTNRLRKDVISGYHCFMQQYMRAKVEERLPLKLPDGTLW